MIFSGKPLVNWRWNNSLGAVKQMTR